LANNTFCKPTEFTVVVAVAVLFAGIGSCSFPETVAVLEITPAVVLCTVMVTVAVAPIPNDPRFAVTIPDEPTGGVINEPCDVVADTKFILAGKLSVTTTPVAPITVLRFFATIV
jgi:hypothetical protein